MLGGGNYQGSSHRPFVTCDGFSTWIRTPFWLVSQDKPERNCHFSRPPSEHVLTPLSKKKQTTAVSVQFPRPSPSLQQSLEALEDPQAACFGRFRFSVKPAAWNAALPVCGSNGRCEGDVESWQLQPQYRRGVWRVGWTLVQGFVHP